ncbi:MAG: hypothetical protein NVS3B5_21360 [Sphingomicrobium sp.]
MSKTTNNYAPEARERAVRIVLDHEREHASRWAAVVSLAINHHLVSQTYHRCPSNRRQIIEPKGFQLYSGWLKVYAV